MMSEALTAFVADISDIVSRGGTEQRVTSDVAARMRELLATRAFLSQDVLRADESKYVMYPLHIDPQGRFSIASAVWDVGQKTPIHDHGTWGVIGIYAGIEMERRYDCDGGAPIFVEEWALRAGEVKVCCTSDADVHAVRCGSMVPCVGIHVYGADIGRLPRHTYDPLTGERKTFVSAWAEPTGSFRTAS